MRIFVCNIFLLYLCNLKKMGFQKCYSSAINSMQIIPFSVQNFFVRFYLFIFTERGRDGEREGEKHQCVVASCVPHAGDLAQNPDMCPDQESNLRPFGSQSRTQSTEPHQPGLFRILKKSLTLKRSNHRLVTF